MPGHRQSDVRLVHRLAKLSPLTIALWARAIALVRLAAPDHGAGLERRTLARHVSGLFACTGSIQIG